MIKKQCLMSIDLCEAKKNILNNLYEKKLFSFYDFNSNFNYLTDENLELVEKSIMNNESKELTLFLCDNRDLKEGVYIGNATSMENKPFERSLLYFKKCLDLEEIVHLVYVSCDVLGKSLFGSSLKSFGRIVEFHDLVFSRGAYNNNGKYISLFLPFYLEHDKYSPVFFKNKRTILFMNLIYERFKKITREISKKHLKINQTAPTFFESNEKEIKNAIALWLTLHEICHGSGPIPLFSSTSRKIDLGLEYAGIEEMRTDMTVWLCLEKGKKIFGPIYRVAQDIILAERLIRSSRVGYRGGWLHGNFLKSSDSENGALWANYMFKSGAININEAGFLDIKLNKVTEKITNILNKYYSYENKVINSQKEGLRKIADFVRKECYGTYNENFVYHKDLYSFYKKLDKYPYYVNFQF